MCVGNVAVVCCGQGKSMSRQAAVNETIEVKVRLLPSGKIVLKSFDWQGRTHYVVPLRVDSGTNGRRTNAFAVSLCRRRTRIRTSCDGTRQRTNGTCTVPGLPTWFEGTLGLSRDQGRSSGPDIGMLTASACGRACTKRTAFRVTSRRAHLPSPVSTESPRLAKLTYGR